MSTHPIELVSAEQYVDDSRYECVDGRLLERPMPNDTHSDLQDRMKELLRPYAQQFGGKVTHEWTISDGRGNWLTPDVTFSYPEYTRTARGHLLIPAYLVVEIRSLDQPIKDLFNKRELYRTWGIPHYWIIDPVESACYECLPEIKLSSDALRADRIEVPVSSIFTTTETSS